MSRNAIPWQRIFVDPQCLQKIARALSAAHLRPLALFLDYFVRWWFSCWLPHGVQIGRGCSFAYGGLGCVIHSDAILGDFVEIGAHVLIGGNAREPGVPIVGSNVYIGFGAVVVGPIRIGDGGVIGAHSVVTTDVLPGAVVAGVPARIIHECVSAGYLYHNRSSQKST